MPLRTLQSIVKKFYGSISIVKPGVKVITIEPSADALSVEQVYKLFSMAFARVCALKVVDGFVVNSLTHELTTAMLTLGSSFNSSKTNCRSTETG